MEPGSRKKGGVRCNSIQTDAPHVYSAILQPNDSGVQVMADPISAEERRNCWRIMSVLFANKEIDYNQVAQRLTQHCPSMTIVSLKQSLFDEVVPAVSAAAMIPAFPLWIQLTPNEVSDLVDDMLVRRNASLRCILGNNFWRLSSRSLARNKWQGLEKELHRVKPHLAMLRESPSSLRGRR